MRENFFSTKEVIEITGETSQRIQYWILHGIVNPYDPSAGTGTARQFSFENLLEILIAQALSPARIYIKIVANIMNQIRRERPDYFKNPDYPNDPGNQSILSIQLIGPRGYATRSIIHSLTEAKESSEEFLGRDLLLIQFNLDVLKANLVNKLKKEQ